MKKFLFTAAIVFCFAFGFAQNATGLTVPVKIMTELNSDKSTNNISACVAEDVKDRQGNVFITGGTRVKINVAFSKSRGMGKEGHLDITCLETYDVNNQTVGLSGEEHLQGEKRLGKALGLGLGLGLTVLCPFGLLFFCIHGEEAVMPAGYVMYNVFTL